MNAEKIGERPTANRELCVPALCFLSSIHFLHENLKFKNDLPTGFALLFALDDIFEQLQRAAQEPL